MQGPVFNDRLQWASAVVGHTDGVLIEVTCGSGTHLSLHVCGGPGRKVGPCEHFHIKTPGVAPIFRTNFDDPQNKAL